MKKTLIFIILLSSLVSFAGRPQIKTGLYHVQKKNLERCQTYTYANISKDFLNSRQLILILIERETENGRVQWVSQESFEFVNEDTIKFVDHSGCFYILRWDEK